MGIFSRKPAYCTICNKQISHKNKAKKEWGGITVGIIPQDDSSHANEFCDIVIPSGMGLTRDFLNALSADGVIVIGGGSGTLSEICAAYMYKKPIVALKNSVELQQNILTDI